MKIKNITFQEIHIPLKTPFITALREVKNVVFIRVSVLCDDGSLRFGEAPATKAITGETIESIKKSIEQIKETFYEVDIQEALSLLHEQAIGSSAKAALDMAFVFLLAEAKKQTLLEYFGIKDTSPIKTDITISLNEANKMMQDAKSALTQQQNILKVKLGSNISHATSVTKALAKELKSATLLIDANQAWSLEESLRYLREVKDCKLELVEQPVPAKELTALKEISHATKISILADEAVFTLADVKYVVENRCADMINIKLMKCGGVSRAVEILEYAREKGITCMLGSMLEGPYSINAAIYLAFAYRDVIKYVDLDSPLLYSEPSDKLDFHYEGAEISFKRVSLQQISAR